MLTPRQPLSWSKKSSICVCAAVVYVWGLCALACQKDLSFISVHKIGTSPRTLAVADCRISRLLRSRSVGGWVSPVLFPPLCCFPLRLCGAGPPSGSLSRVADSFHGLTDCAFWRQCIRRLHYAGSHARQKARRSTRAGAPADSALRQCPCCRIWPLHDIAIANIVWYILQ